MLTDKDVQRWKKKISNGECCGADLPQEYQRLLSDIKHRHFDTNAYSPIFLWRAQEMGLITYKCNLTPTGKFFNEHPFKQFRVSGER